MTVWRNSNFKGELPKLHPRMLPEGYAQSATGARFEDGALSPTRTQRAVETLTQDAQSIYLHDGQWLSWNAEVDVVKGPTKTERLYITGDGTPKLRIDPDTFDLAIEQPVRKPIVSANSAVDEATKQTVLYAYTFVTQYDEETAPSPISDPLEVSPGVVVNVSDFSVPAIGRNIDRIRLYRTETSTLGTTDLYFVAEFPVSNLVYNHDLLVEPLQEIIPSRDYDLPSAGLKGITSMPNGMMAAYEGKTLRFSEPYRPHAWPIKYELITDFEIMGLVAFNTTLVILTKGQPYIAQGSAPENMQMDKVEQNFPCVSTRGVVDMGYAAIYPSTDGLVSISASGAQMISKGLWTREQFDAMNPDTIVAGQWSGKYVFTYDDSALRQQIIVDLIGEQPFVVRDDFNAEAMHYDLETGRLYGLIGLRNIVEWDSLTNPLGTYEWTSGLRQTQWDETFGCYLVEGEDQGLDVTVTVFAGPTQIYSKIATIGEVHKLPAGIRSKRWSVRLSGTDKVSAIHIAGNTQELLGA